MRTTIQIVYDVGRFGKYDNKNAILQDFSLIEVTQRRRPNLDPIIDYVIQSFYSKT